MPVGIGLGVEGAGGFLPELALHLLRHLAGLPARLHRLGTACGLGIGKVLRQGAGLGTECRLLGRIILQAVLRGFIFPQIFNHLPALQLHIASGG